MRSDAHRRSYSRLAAALASAGLLAASLLVADDPVAAGLPAAAAAAGATLRSLARHGPAAICGPVAGSSLKIPSPGSSPPCAKTETTPFQPQPMKAAGGDVPLYRDLGTLAFPITTRNAKAPGLLQPGHAAVVRLQPRRGAARLPGGAEARSGCAACFWGEALILGPNINVPMMPEANAPALAALGNAVALKARAAPRSRP
jgi:hypothetical protein